MSWFSKLFGGDKAAKKPVAPAPLPEPMQMSLEERMALRREMVFKAVRETMLAQGFLSTGYKVNVVRTDTRGHIYAVMVDIGTASEAGRALSTQEEMLRIEAQIMEIAKSRYRVKVSNVFWRVVQPAPAQAAPVLPRRGQTTATTAVDTDVMAGDFVSAPSSPVPIQRGTAVNPSTNTARPAPAPAPAENDPSGLLLGSLFGSKPAGGRDGFPDTVMEEQTVRMERVTEDEMEAFAQALAAAHSKDPVHVGSRTYQTDYAPLE
jgi:hypothetical protein